MSRPPQGVWPARCARPAPGAAPRPRSPRPPRPVGCGCGRRWRPTRSAPPGPCPPRGRSPGSSAAGCPPRPSPSASPATCPAERLHRLGRLDRLDPGPRDREPDRRPHRDRHLRAAGPPGHLPGGVLARVAKLSAAGKYEDFTRAVNALDGALGLSRPGATRILVIVSDGRYKGTQHADGQKLVTRLAASGCLVIWIAPSDTAKTMTGAGVVILADPAGTSQAVAPRGHRQRPHRLTASCRRTGSGAETGTA
jgi:hypothetical protein